MKAALDCVVLKQGVFNLVFHPHGWIKPEQVVELIDHAVAKHGKKVKFLNFREAQERLNKNLLRGKPCERRRERRRNPTGRCRRRRLSRSRPGRTEAERLAPGLKLPPGARLVDDQGRDAGLRFVDLDEDGQLDVVFSNDQEYGIYLFDREQKGWTRKVMAGKAGEPGALAQDRPRRHQQRLLRPLATPLVAERRYGQAAQPGRSPVVQRPVEGRRAAGQVARGVARSRSRSRPASRSSWSPPSRWSKTRSPSTGGPTASSGSSRWATIPLGVDGKGKPGGVVRFLEDTDGDGRYDKQTTFLDGLGFPTGVMPWRKGVLVACAPDIFYAEDRDGDGKADHREVLFTGFVEGNQQHRLNGFELGLDGWVYGANGDSGGTVRSLKTGKTTSISGRDFRFRPDTGEFEAESGQTQYGRHRDDWGHWFGNNNPNWGWHYVLADHDLRRNPQLRPARPAADARARHPALSDQPHARPVQRPRRGQPRHLGQQPDALPRRPLRPRVRHQPVRQRAGAQPGASDGARARRRDLPRPSRAERGRAASSSPRATTGSGRRCSRPAPTVRSGSPTCIARSSSTPSGFPTTGRSGSTSAPAASRGGSTASIPVDKKPRPIPRLDRLDTRRPRRRARQPQRLAARHGPAAAAAPRATRPRSRRSEHSVIAHEAAQDARPGDLDARRSGRPRRAVGPGRPRRIAIPGSGRA